jgi:hypothetical protein
VELPDGNRVAAASFHALDPYTRDRQPDYGLRRESGRGAGSTATSAADHRRVNSSPSPARRRCTARELAGNPLVGYLLTGVTIDARPGSVEVFGRTLLIGCMSALASAVVRR